MMRPTAVGQHYGPIEKEREEIHRAVPGTQTVGQMAMRVHIGWWVCPIVLLALCVCMNAYSTCVFSCVCMCDGLVSNMCTYGLCILCSRMQAYILCASMCDRNKLLFGQFTDPNITTTMGQTDPQHEWLVCRRRAKNTTLLTSVGRQQYTTTHGPPTWHSSVYKHISTNTRRR